MDSVTFLLESSLSSNDCVCKKATCWVQWRELPGCNITLNSGSKVVYHSLKKCYVRKNSGFYNAKCMCVCVYIVYAYKCTLCVMLSLSWHWGTGSPVWLRWSEQHNFLQPFLAKLKSVTFCRAANTFTWIPLNVARSLNYKKLADYSPVNALQMQFCEFK